MITDQMIHFASCFEVREKMSSIRLTTASQGEVTLLSNIFIDTFLPEAGGEFVKVYIYLLRLLGDPSRSLGLDQMADCLHCTEGDLLRAFKYWSAEGLLTLRFDEEQVLSQIILEDPSAPAAPAPSPQEEPKPSPKALSLSEAPKAAAPSQPPKTLTADRVSALKEEEEVVQLLYICEQYLGKTLSPTEVQKLLFFYDGLHMSVDLIDFLIQYCVGRGHKSIRYIETVALAWADEGITTVEMAKASSSRYGKDYFTILKAMGITGRNPISTEVAFMDTWMKDYGFSMDIILEACTRTVLQTGQPSFPYVDGILSDWHKKGVRTLADIQPLDQQHQKRRLQKSQGRGAVPKSQAQNRFNNFPQREYDFAEYEKLLLNR